MRNKTWLCVSVYFMIPLIVIVAVHYVLDAPSEPFFNNDETRHVMTGVYFHDALQHGYWRDFIAETKKYYLQYPALGLIVWPPLYYVIEGCWMSVFGIDIQIARLLIAFFGFLAAIGLFRIINRYTHWTIGSLSIFLAGLSPLIFTFSRQVMLELPCLAILLHALFYFERYLDDRRPIDSWLACILAACAALTRFDAVVLLPYFFLRLLLSRNLSLIRSRLVYLPVAAALILTVPYYAYTWSVYGSTIAKTVQEGTHEGATGFLSLHNFLYYPLCVPTQVGWVLTVFSVLGGLLSLIYSTLRTRCTSIFYALTISTYATFTPMAELDPRHAIYWIPSLVYFSIQFCRWLVPQPRLFFLLSFLLIAGTMTHTILATRIYNLGYTFYTSQYYVRGYEQASKYVVDNTHQRQLCLMDGFLNGSFIYYVRQHDPQRRLWVLRGDKILYSVICEPKAALSEYARSEQEVLQLIHKYDPEYIVVEEPQLYFSVPAAALLRDVLHHHPDKFKLEVRFPIESNQPRFRNASIEIWRHLDLHQDHDSHIEFEMLNLGRTLGGTIN